MRGVFAILLLAIATPVLSAQTQEDFRAVMAELQRISTRVDAIERQQATINAKLDLALQNKSQFEALSSRIDAIVFEQPKNAAPVQSSLAWGSGTTVRSAWGVGSTTNMMSLTAGACANGSCGTGRAGLFGRLRR